MTTTKERFGPLHEREFRLLWSGQALSAVGDAVVPVALALAVVQAGGGPSQLGLVLGAALVPRVLLLLVGGVWADRLPRQRVMLVADLVRAATQAVIAGELLLGELRIAHLVPLAVVTGVASAFFAPASGALVPSTVSEGRRQAANALLGLSRNGAQVLGPALAGVLVATVGAGWAFALDSASFLVSAGTLALLRVPHVPAARRPFTAELAEGWVELRRHRWYWTNLLAHACWNAAMATFWVLGPVVAVRELGGAGSWGAVATACAVGSTLGGALALRLRPPRPLLHANLALALAALPLALLAGPAPVVPLALAGAAALGGLAYMSALWETAVQRHVPPAALSRVVAYDWLVSLVVSPLAYVLVGPVVAAVGTRSTLLGAAALLGLTSLGVLAVRDVRTLGTGGARTAARDVTRVAAPPHPPEESSDDRERCAVLGP
ncbi:MAG TPA: MFS transporter [Candidatus Eisenbacteria bacterium]|nr:MFS transporter [Candidatus Eisenbacteria bacterium]